MPQGLTTPNRIAGYENDPRYWLPSGEIPIEDLLLRNILGSDISKYDEILKDPNALACLQNRIGATLSREVRVVPASEKRADKKAADLVSEQLLGVRWAGSKRESGAPSSVNFDQFCSSLMMAILRGFQAVEVSWQKGRSGWQIAGFTPIPSRRIKFELVTKDTPRNAVTHMGYAVKILTRDKPFRGEFITTPYRILVYTFDIGGGSNPYGLGLGSVLWWYCQFKKDCLKDWLVAVSRATALIRAAFPAGVGEGHPVYEEVKSFLEYFAPEHHLIAPDGVVIDFLESARNDRDIQHTMCEFLDNQIARVIGGQTALTNQQSGGGSRARDEVAERVAMKLAKSDSDALSGAALNTLAEWITRLNLPSSQAPTIWRDFDDVENLTERADRDQKLAAATGRKLDPDYVTEIYGTVFAEPEPVDPIPPDPNADRTNPEPPNPEPPAFSLTGKYDSMFDAANVELLQAEQKRRGEVWNSIQGAPYVRYVRVREVQNPRETHTAMEGKVFPNDATFWSKACPPSAFYCGHSLEPVGADYDGEITPLPQDAETLRHLIEWESYDETNRKYFELGGD
ncbi:DUF935 family protein [Limnothrix sp. PR1529]|uniref:phage portal protein family protein n=1 Tax=Limnothrix sp. PR1529 TaxID=1704291 RepID=UPI000C1510B7|nr:DUF935 family protein [Limnothrix sp. PR1529]